VALDLARLTAEFHIAFNVATEIVFIGLLDGMARLLEKLLPNRVQEADPSRPRHLGESALETPSLALATLHAPTLGSKSTFRPEMHLAFCPSRQVIEVAHIFSTLRAHHKPTFSVEIAHAQRPTRSEREVETPNITRNTRRRRSALWRFTGSNLPLDRSLTGSSAIAHASRGLRI
jgi:hypothetical protein